MLSIHQYPYSFFSSEDGSWIHTEAAVSGHNSPLHKVKAFFLFHAIFIQGERKFLLASVGSRYILERRSLSLYCTCVKGWIWPPWACVRGHVCCRKSLRMLLPHFQHSAGPFLCTCTGIFAHSVQLFGCHWAKRMAGTLQQDTRYVVVYEYCGFLE